MTDKRHTAPIAVLGAGSWGTALAIQFARSGKLTRLWSRDAKRLPAATADFPEALTTGTDLAAAVRGAQDVLVVVPSHGLREVLAVLAPLLAPRMRLAWATKGFEPQSGQLPHQVARDILGGHRSLAVLSGPTFAREVRAGLPTAMTVASPDATFAAALARDLSCENFRAYTSTDIVGVEVGGAVKNVLAIGAGLSDGLGFGANTRVALITRGLVEMTRLGTALGARAETFMGLAGLGDLVLTSTDDESRNRRLGLLLAAGRTVEQARAQIGQVVEGVFAAKAVRGVAAREHVEMPLCAGLYQILYESRPAREVVRALMARPIKPELE
ncbi:MAG: NAD(P)H-dependent glycerol-3-phosphate dehydrogenase [Steroidobacteraceae bacterium]